MLKKRWYLLIIVICLSLSAAVAYSYYQKYQSVYKQNVESVIETSQFQLLFTAREFYQFDIQVSSTIDLLNQNKSLLDYISMPNFFDKQQVEQVWSVLTGYQSFFKQIRLVDTKGNEQIKVEYSYLDNKPVAKSEYVNISEQPYFEFANGLSSGEIGTLGVSLETDLGDSFEPYIPIQHIIYPYDINGERKGFLILSIDFWLSSSVLDYSPQARFKPRIITMQGDYVVHPQPEKLYGFAISDRKQFNLSVSNPELWLAMKKTPTGVFEQNDNVYIYQHIQISSGSDFYTLIEFPQETLMEHVNEEYSSIVQAVVLIIFAIVLAGIPVGYWVFLSQKRSLDSKLAIAALNGMSAVMICDSHFRMVKINREFENITGYKESHIRHGNLRKLLFDKRDSTGWFNVWDCVEKERFWEGELKISGQSNIELITITRIQAIFDLDNKVTNYIISLVDISEQKALEQRLRYLSERDELSQLWNRRKFEQELQNETMLVGRYPENHIGCLALIDIDLFKRINDEQGHDEGDRVINQVANHLKENTRQTDFVARIGGEEFAILMPHTEIAEAEIVLNRIRATVGTDERNKATISIGVTNLNKSATHSYKCADIALYQSKSLGRNQTSTRRSDDEISD